MDDQNRYLHLIRTEGLKATVYVCTSCTVCHCRQQVWIFTLLLSRRWHPLMQDSRAQPRKDPQKSKKTRLPTDPCLNNSMYKHHLVLKKASAALCHHRAFIGSKSSRQVGRSVSVHKISRCILPLLCTLPLLCFLQLLS